MPDEFDFRPSLPSTPGPVTLAELPLLAPPRSAWPALQATLDARRARRRPLWLAAAAALLLALALPRYPTTDGPAAPPATAQVEPAAPASESAALQALMAESAQLETLLAWSRAERVESAVAASLGAVLQDRLETIDGVLARSDADPDALLPLWQERVLRLRQLAGLESTQQLLAANGQADSGVPVLAF